MINGIIPYLALDKPRSLSRNNHTCLGVRHCIPCGTEYIDNSNTLAFEKAHKIANLWYAFSQLAAVCSSFKKSQDTLGKKIVSIIETIHIQEYQILINWDQWIQYYLESGKNLDILKIYFHYKPFALQNAIIHKDDHLTIFEFAISQCPSLSFLSLILDKNNKYNFGLLEKVNSSFSKTCPLLRPCNYKNEPIFKLLLENGVEIDKKNSLGETILHEIANNFRSSLPLQMLLKYHPNLEIKNNNGLTPLEIAVSKVMKEFPYCTRELYNLRTLLEAGSKVTFSLLSYADPTHTEEYLHFLKDAFRPYLKSIDWLQTDEAGNTYLHWIFLNTNLKHCIEYFHWLMSYSENVTLKNQIYTANIYGQRPFDLIKDDFVREEMLHLLTNGKSPDRIFSRILTGLSEDQKTSSIKEAPPLAKVKMRVNPAPKSIPKRIFSFLTCR